MRSHILLAFLVVLITAYACKEGSTIGAIGTEDNDTTIFEFPQGKPPPTDGFYFYGKVDGHYHCIIEDTAGYLNAADSTRLFECDTISFKDEQRTRLFRPNDNRFIFQIRQFQCLIDTTDSVLFKVAGYDTTWETGAFPFVEPEDVYNGVEVLWTDDRGEIFTSIPGSGNPQRSYFQFQSIERNMEDTLSYAIVKGTFVGTLWNFDQTEVVSITESQFRLRFVQIPDSIYPQL